MILWTKRRKVEALVAASLYEPLKDEERRTLDAALAADPRLRAEAQALGRVRRAVRMEAPEFTGDLVPLLHARLMETTPARHGVVSWRLISGATVAVGAAVILFVSVVGVPGGPAGAPVGIKTVPSAPLAAVSPVRSAISSASGMLASHNVLGARTVLDQALAGNPADAASGEAQALLAGLEYSEFQRYPEAYAAYDRLRTRYPKTFMNSPENIQRFNLLDEARRSGYAPMYALEAIRNNPAAAFEKCERLVAQYPDSMVASLAMNEMRAAVGLPGPLDGSSHAIALERVRNRCSDPAAVAQVTLALGNVYRDDLCDTRSARLFYNEAASSGHTPVVVRAQEALAKLAMDTP